MGSVLYSGGRLESMNVISGSPADYTANNTRWDTSYSDAALALNNGVAGHELYDSSMAATTVTGGQTFWWHACVYCSSFNAANIVTLYDSSGNAWLRLRVQQDTSNLFLEANTGTSGSPTWTQLGSTQSPSTGLRVFDLSVAVASSGSHSATLYLDGAATTATGSWSQSSLTNIAEVRLSAAGTNSSPLFSQIVATEGISTVGAKVKTCRATGAGANSGWTGAYTDVNEADDNDTTVNTTATVNVVQTYPVTNVTVPTGLSIQAVFHWVRGRSNGASPNNIASVARNGGTDYVSSALSGITTSFGALGMRYNTDPSTGAAWTQSGFNTPAQFGFKSLT